MFWRLDNERRYSCIFILSVPWNFQFSSLILRFRKCIHILQGVKKERICHFLSLFFWENEQPIFFISWAVYTTLIKKCPTHNLKACHAFRCSTNCKFIFYSKPPLSQLVILHVLFVLVITNIKRVRKKNWQWITHPYSKFVESVRWNLWYT